METNNTPPKVDKRELEQPVQIAFPSEVVNNNLYDEEDQILFKKNCSKCLNNGKDTERIIPPDDRKIIEVAGKGLLNSFFCVIPEDFVEQIDTKDQIIVKIDEYYENCIVTVTEKSTKLRREKLRLSGEILPVLIRKVTSNDLEIISKNSSEELKAKNSFIVKVTNSNLNMKLVSIHFQFDRKKLFFFYTSENRVDFRVLAKDLASEFKTRIELRQVGVRDGTKRLGGMGVCGREFCCTSFINNFKPITNQNNIKQNFPANINKNSGPCGKLKCCFIYESD